MFSAFRFLAGINISTPADRPARFLVHHNRPLMENLGFMHVEQGESSDDD